MSYQVIKLANGEDIVCNLVKRFGSKIEVTSPLRMDTITKETAKGTMESLALSRWVQPYSDEKVFNIESNSAKDDFLKLCSAKKELYCSNSTF